MSSSEFCGFHTEIDGMIKRSYRLWSEAYNERLSNAEFLRRILSLSDTGEEAKRVASHLLSKETESLNVDYASDL